MTKAIRYLDLHTFWRWAVQLFAVIGGSAGIVRLIEWLFSGPRIIGEVENIVYAEECDAQEQHLGTLIMAQLYAVNRRIQPTTIRGARAWIKVRGTWKLAELRTIPDNFALRGLAVDFSKSRFYDAAWHLMQYGVGIRGWMSVFVPNERQQDLLGAPIKFALKDAFGKEHKLYYKRSREAREGLSFYPGSGMRGG